MTTLVRVLLTAVVLIGGVIAGIYFVRSIPESPVAVEEPVEEVVEAPPQRQWSIYMQEWLQTNRLVVDYLNVKEKEWCAVAIQRINPEHPGAEPVLECIQ